MTDDAPAFAAPAAPAPFSRERFVLESGRVRLEVGAVAAVLCELRVDGIRLTETVPRDGVPPSGAGMVLAPWPNRVRGGRWRLDGEEQQLALSDPGFRGATHGLLRNTAYAVRERTETAITLGALIAPQQGWPFLLDSWVRYRLDAAGVTVTHGAENRGSRRAPWAVGAHPYFRLGEREPATLELTVAGATRFEVDDALVPVATVPVDGTDFDLRRGRRLGDVDVNTGYGELGLGPDGGIAGSLRAPDGARVDVHHGPAFAWTQVFTPRDFPRAEGRGLAVALEPMTAPPNALNSGEGLVWLEPGERWEGSWSVDYTPAPGDAPGDSTGDAAGDDGVDR